MKSDSLLFAEKSMAVVKTVLLSEYNKSRICNIATAYIYQILHDNNIESKIAFGMYKTKDRRYFHCWNLVDEYVIDITNEQFDSNLPNIFKKSDAEYMNYEEGVIFNIPMVDVNIKLYEKITKKKLTER